MARRARIIDWLNTCAAEPEVVFVGTIHRSVRGDDGAEQLAQIDGVQAWAYEIVLREMADASVIVIEQSGSEIPLTQESYVAQGIAAIVSIEGDRIGTGKMRRMLERDTSATSRIVFLPERPPVLCGEEWLLPLSARIVLLAPFLPGRQLAVADAFIGALARLRSELILIRSLEWLRRNNGHKAIVLQGKSHGPQIAELQPLYRISLRLILPT